MGRAGGGGGGGSFHSSSSSHSFSSHSHSGSSHSFGGSSGRAGRSSSSGSYRRSSSGVHYHRSHTYVNVGGPRYGYGHSTDSGIAAFILAAVIFVAIFILIAMFNSSPSVSNTTNREKLELGYGYANDTLLDELDWIKNPGRVNRDLKGFYEKTGIIPYIALVSRPELRTSAEEEAYAHQWYDSYLPHQGYLLLMYFDTGNPNVDGNCYLVCGEQVGALFDAEAQNIFWEYLDRYWYSDLDEDALFTEAFIKTGDRIMQRGSATTDVLKKVMAFCIVAAVIFAVFKFMAVRRRYEAERAAETAEILSKPIRSAESSASEDDLLNKYTSSDGDDA